MAPGGAALRAGGPALLGALLVLAPLARKE
jgi:hypothetical protein